MTTLTPSSASVPPAGLLHSDIVKALETMTEKAVPVLRVAGYQEKFHGDLGEYTLPELVRMSWDSPDTSTQDLLRVLEGANSSETIGGFVGRYMFEVQEQLRRMLNEAQPDISNQVLPEDVMEILVHAKDEILEKAEAFSLNEFMQEAGLAA